jgi:hypothetical protein
VKLDHAISSHAGPPGQLPPECGTIFRIKAGAEFLQPSQPSQPLQPLTQAILAVKGHPYKHVFHAVLQTCLNFGEGAQLPAVKAAIN